MSSPACVSCDARRSHREVCVDCQHDASHTTRMLLDSHMHVGDFPYFNVSIDRDGLVARCASTGSTRAWCSTRTTAGARHRGRDPGLYGLVWVNPREPMPPHDRGAPGRAGSRFRGVKLHPLLDGYHPDDPMVHPIIELLIERGCRRSSTAAIPSSRCRGASRSSSGDIPRRASSSATWATATSCTSTRPSMWPPATPTCILRHRACRCTRRSARRSSGSDQTGSCTARTPPSITRRWSSRRCA